ncbi:MAG: NAD(P)/FAD-dependent oxidoreductase [Chloroflexi bacterium]|nr:NAD(P)/FAD-dependent oxidoreductase [Chloroflexota bacterium]
MKTAIIGAGVAGLAAAWDLARAGHEVVVFEAADRVGGLASGFKDESWAWSLEKFYHHWFETDADLLRFARELGLDEKIMFPRPKTSYWLDGKIYRSEMNLSTLQLPLSWIGLIRLGLAGVFLKLTPWWQPLENTTADAWLRRWMGNEVYTKLWCPLLIGKFADRYRDVNMAWMWARIKARSVKLGTYEGGFQSFVDDAADVVRRAGVDIRLSTPVTSLEQVSAGWRLTAANTDIIVDRVLSTSSPSGLLKQAPALANTDYGRAVASLDSIGAVCVVYALKRSVLTDGTYWLNLPAASADKAKNPFPFLAMVEHTNWLDSANYDGDVLVYCGDYADPNHEYFTLSDEDMIDRFAQAFKTVNPDYEPSWIRKAWVWRAPYAQPVPKVGHSACIPDLATPLPGLWWASMSQVYPWDRGTNYAVEIGRRAARRIIAEAGT